MEDECFHEWLFVELSKVTFQDLERISNTNVEILFELEAKCACLKCGLVDYGIFTRTIEAQFSLNLSREDDDGESDPALVD